MKILFATMRFGRSCYQGTERYLADLGNGLGRLGHEVVYLAGDPDHTRPPLPLGTVVESDPPVLAYPTAGWAGVCGLGPSDLAAVVKEQAPDLVHLANPAHIGVGLAETCRLLGIPYVITTMDSWWLCPKATLSHFKGSVCDGRASWRECLHCIAADNVRSITRFAAHLPSPILAAFLAIRGVARGMAPADIRRWFHRRESLTACLNGAGHVIFPSRAIESAIRPLLDHDRYSWIPHGLDERWFASAAAAKRTSAEGDAASPPTIGFAGTLARHKAPHLLLEAVRRLGWNDCIIRLAGGVGERAYVRRLHDLAAGLRVEFVGLVPPEKMPEFLRSLDVLVVPSTWPENAPYIVLEGVASGVCVIASRIGGMPEMISNPECLFDVNSVSDLATALRRWRGCSAEKAGPATNVITADEMAARTLRVYEQLTVARC